MSLKVGQLDLQTVTSTLHLGIFPDSNLRWDIHITNLCSKISPKIGLLYRLKKLLPVRHVEMVYKAIVQPHIDYCLTVWGFASKKYIDKVQKLQNRAARIITGNYDKYDTRGISLVKKLHWQTVTERRDYFVALLVHKALNGNTPVYIEDLFTPIAAVQTRVTRLSDSSNLVTPRAHRHMFLQSLQYNGPLIWNSLPEHLKTVDDFNHFKALAKKHFS